MRYVFLRLRVVLIIGSVLGGFTGVVVLLALTLSITVIAYEKRVPQIPATYPSIAPPTDASFFFRENTIAIRLSTTTVPSRILVFAYDRSGCQYSIFKPVYENTVTINHLDQADFRVRISSQGTVEGNEFLRTKPGEKGAVNFFRLLLAAKEHGFKYGIQECLYPMEQQCVNVCPVTERKLITFSALEDGRIVPKIDVWGCPRTGRCIYYCPQGIIRRVEEKILGLE